ncbi:MAG: D-erythronate dehydrogenase [Streptosporangiaceae bacterium]
MVVTGGGGFLGARLARELLAAGSLEAAGGEARPLTRLTLIDQAPVPEDLAADERVAAIRGDLGALLGPGGAGALGGAEVIFHLAAAVSGECEADFDLGLRANLRAAEALLACCRAAGSRPVVVFASSVAVFGGSAEHPLPDLIEDHTLPVPQTSYGTQKFMMEQLLADYTRKGFLDGRAVRLMTVSVRPGRPNGAASGFLSGIIREPLAGLRATCPVNPGTEVALASPDKAIAALLCAARSPAQAWGRSAVTMPALTLTVAEMVAALARVAGPQVSALIDWVPDPVAAGMFANWPARIRADRAAALGMAPDPDFESVIRMHLAETRSGGAGLPALPAGELGGLARLGPACRVLATGELGGHQAPQAQDLGVARLQDRLDHVHRGVHGGLRVTRDAVPQEAAGQRPPEQLRGDGQQVCGLLAGSGCRRGAARSAAGAPCGTARVRAGTRERVGAAAAAR